MHTRHLNDDQPRATLGTCLLIGDQPFRYMAVMGHDRIMTRRQDAVLDFHATDSERREEVGKESHKTSQMMMGFPIGRNESLEYLPKHAKR